jgi:LacI family transcriptional regulator
MPFPGRHLVGTVPMPRSFPPANARVGLREVAAAAGFCVMTVSLALRDNPRISAATRDRVKQIAGELGYRPDPELSRLMNHLRASRTARGKTSVAVIDFFPTADYPENAYNRQVRLGATRRAAQLGFSITRFHGADYRHNLRNLLKVVRARGIEGALLMPSVVPLELDLAVSWDGLSVVATSKSILAPRFHCVVPNHFGNMMRLLDRMRQIGGGRICTVFDELFHERTGQGFAAAVKWHGLAPYMLVIRQDLTGEARDEQVAAWIARHRPDAVFAQGEAVVQALPRIKAIRPRLDLPVVGLGAHNFGGFSYLDESADLVGSAAIDLLGGMMYYHETGIPDHPRTTAIDGALVARGRLRSAPKDSGRSSAGGSPKSSRSVSNS